MIAVGLDLGQRRDPTAIVVVETNYHGATVRAAERVMLGTPWAQVVERVKTVVTSPRLLGRCALAVDATGVGSPVVEMLKTAGLGCDIAAVTITSGEHESETSHCNWNVPKKDLMTALQLGIESGEIRIAQHMNNVGSLLRELLDIRVTGVRIGANRHNQHDDLVIALALAVWQTRHKKKMNFFGDKRLLW